MNWTILNVSIPVHDLDKSKQFYEMLIGSAQNSEILMKLVDVSFPNAENIFHQELNAHFSETHV